MTKGYIYIMTNPCLQDMVKLGFATNVEERLKQILTNQFGLEIQDVSTLEQYKNNNLAQNNKNDLT